MREARERVRSAITNSGFEFPQKRITINLAPAYLRKIGPGFDLPLAIAILAASGQVRAEAIADCALAGELSLTGELRPMRGALAVAQGAAAHGIGRVVVPVARAREAALVEGVEVIGVAALHEAVDVLAGRREVPPLPELEPEAGASAALEPPDLADVRGHDALLPAIVVAAAGGHNLFLHGPPGTGKTMLARRLPSILPPLTRAEAIEVTRIHSIAGLHVGRRARRGAAVPRAASHDLAVRARRRRRACRRRARSRSPTTACCSSTSCRSSRARRSRRCASRSRTAAS